MNRLRTCLLASVCGWAPSGIAGILEAPKFIKDSWNKEVAASDLEFNTKTWIRMFLDGKDQDAAHNWSSVGPKTHPDGHEACCEWEPLPDAAS